MKRYVSVSAFAVGLVCAAAAPEIYRRLTDPPTKVQAKESTEAQAKESSEAKAKKEKSAEPSPVGAWFGVARPCPAALADIDHAALCQQICGQCTSIPGTLPPEVPMMPSILADGNVVVNDAGSIPVFHTTAQGSYAADTDPYQVQIPGRARYQASFVWLQGSSDKLGRVNADPNVPEVNRAFVGVARPRFVTFFDPKNPDAMFGYIQPHFFPIVNPTTGLVNVLAPNIAGSFEGTHQIALNFLGALPAGCQNDKGCLGTYHFTIHRIKPNVPNPN